MDQMTRLPGLDQIARMPGVGPKRARRLVDESGAGGRAGGITDITHLHFSVTYALTTDRRR